MYVKKTNSVFCVLKKKVSFFPIICSASCLFPLFLFFILRCNFFTNISNIFFLNNWRRFIEPPFKPVKWNINLENHLWFMNFWWTLRYMFYFKCHSFRYGHSMMLSQGRNISLSINVSWQSRGAKYKRVSTNQLVVPCRASILHKNSKVSKTISIINGLFKIFGQRMGKQLSVLFT